MLNVECVIMQDVHCSGGFDLCSGYNGILTIWILIRYDLFHIAKYEKLTTFA
ncbi:MAG: hypothetical protein J6X18_14225 [Bacteroidales bacterium]|nr:hypothetical protein [Bacteroidales bacterium]